MSESGNAAIYMYARVQFLVHFRIPLLVNFKDTPTICKIWLKSKFLVYGDYFDTRIQRVSHFFQVVDMRLKSNFLLSLSINHAYDVINLNINERVQKTFAPHHFELVRKASILIIILTSICQYAKVICIRFHRTLCDDQEIDRRSKIFAPHHLKSVG